MYCFRFTEDSDENGNNVPLTVDGWFSPQVDNNYDYEKYVKVFSKKIKQMTYDIRELIGYHDYIVSLDMRPSGIKFNKYSYMCIDIMLFGNQKKPDVNLYLSMLDKLLKEDKVMKFQKNKTEAV